MYFLHVKVEGNGKIELYPTPYTEDNEKKLNFFYEKMGVSLIDIIAYDDKVDFIVDDEGLFVEHNPVFAINSPLYSEPIHVVGEFMVGKKHRTDDGGVETIGFKDVSEMKELLKGIELRFVGYVN